MPAVAPVPVSTAKYFLPLSPAPAPLMPYLWSSQAIYNYNVLLPLPANPGGLRGARIGEGPASVPVQSSQILLNLELFLLASCCTDFLFFFFFPLKWRKKYFNTGLTSASEIGCDRWRQCHASKGDGPFAKEKGGWGEPVHVPKGMIWLLCMSFT